MTEDDFRALFGAASELARAREQFADFTSPHEGYAVLREELDELWDEVKANNIERARAEAIQVAAMALRFWADLTDTGVASKTTTGAGFIHEARDAEPNREYEYRDRAGGRWAWVGHGWSRYREQADMWGFGYDWATVPEDNLMLPWRQI